MAIMASIAGRTIYCLDTSALLVIQQTYPPTMFQDLWDQMGDLARNTDLQAPREVFNELRWSKSGDDDLRKWADVHRYLFVNPDSEQLSVTQEIVNDTEFRGLVDVDSEVPDAAPFVIALSVVQQRRNGGSLLRANWVVVADEDGSQPRAVPKIPDICRHPRYGIQTVTALDMLRNLDFRLPPSQRGLGALYGVWRGVDISEKEIDDAKLRGRGL